MNNSQKKVINDIKNTGWHVIMIPEDDEGPSFAYSIGFVETFGHPEVILFGLPIEFLHVIINNIGYEIKEGNTFKVNNFYDSFYEGVRCTFRKVPETKYPDFLGQAVNHYGKKMFPALQCIWSDRNGIFPWDDSAPKTFVEQQPVLDSD